MSITAKNVLSMYDMAVKEQETFPKCVRVFMVVDGLLKAVTDELPVDIFQYVETHVLNTPVPCATCGSITEVMHIHEDTEMIACVKCEKELPYTKEDIESLPHEDRVYAFTIPLEKNFDTL